MIAEKYNHEDIKRCGELSSQVKKHLRSLLDFNFYRMINDTNLKFILGVACLLGGAIFKDIPKMIKAVEAQKATKIERKTIRQVIQVFFNETMACILADDPSLINEKTYALI